MKTTTKAILGISVAMIVLGTGLSVMAWAVAGGDIGVNWNPRQGLTRPSFSRSASRDLQKNSVSVQAFTSVDLDTDYGNVKFIASDAYRVEYAMLSSYPAPEISVNAGKLTVRNKTDFDGINLFGFSGFPFGSGHDLDDAYIHVYYPTGTQLSSVTLADNLGTIELSDVSITGELSITADLGEVELENMSAGSTIVNASLGSVKCRNFTSSRFDASLSMGDLDVEDSTLSNIDVNSSMGKIELSGNLSGNIHLDCDMGDIELRTSRPRSEFNINVSTDMGETRVDGERTGSSYTSSGASTFTVSCSMGVVDLRFGVA